MSTLDIGQCAPQRSCPTDVPSTCDNSAAMAQVGVSGPPRWLVIWLNRA